jgi:hypothetical protein
MDWSGKVTIDGIEYELVTVCVTKLGGTYLVMRDGVEAGILDTMPPNNEIYPSPRGDVDRDTIAKIGSEARRRGLI